MYPKVIYFCNKIICDKTIKYSMNWKKLNPEYDIKLYDNMMCESFLLNEYGDIYRDIFNFLQDGPIKADFWRLCILYKYGGVYSDIDTEPLVPIDNFIEPNINFATCSSYWDAMKFNFNPNFIISEQNNIILKKCIEWYIDNYKNGKKYNYWDYSIMKVFTDTLKLDNYIKNDGIYYLDNMKIQIIKECVGNNHYDAHNIYNNIRVFNNRYADWDHTTHSFN